MSLSVLTVGTEFAVLSPESPVRKRIFSYGKYFKEMHVVLMCSSTGQADVHEGNVTVYPTNSTSKIHRYFDALRIGKQVADVDIVSAQDPFETALVAWLIARRHKAALHVQVHTDFLAPAYAAHSFINRIRVLIAKFVVRKAAHIRVVSERVRERVIQLRPEAPVSVLPIYVDLERFRSAAMPTDLSLRFAGFSHRMLVVSRLEPEKNVSLAIRAFKESAPPEACLIILGSGSEYTTLEMLVTKLGLDERIFFEGHQDPAPYYALSDLVLVPSVYEGYGQVIIEALAARKPVLSTDVGIARSAGAIVTTTELFPKALAEWVVSGPRAGELKNYPYASMDEYVQMYCADIAAAKPELRRPSKYAIIEHYGEKRG